MIAYIVCEGTSDVELLRKTLPKELLDEVGFVAGGRLSSVKSLARSLIVRRQVPIAIVADADSIVPSLIQERISGLEELMESVAINTPVKAILAVPSIDIIFFQDTALLCRALGYEPSQEVLNLAISQPKQVIQQLIAQSQMSYSQFTQQFTQQFTNEDLEVLRKSPVIEQMIQFLQSVKMAVAA